MPAPFSRHLVRAAAVAAAATALTSLAPAASAAAPTQRGLLLTVSGSGGTWIRGVVLRCPSGAGAHPSGKAACTALAWAGGDPDYLPGDPHACTKEFDPVTATVSGTWRGKPVDWEETFANGCVLDTETGPVFRF